MDILTAAVPTLVGFVLGILSNSRWHAGRLYELAAKMPEGSEVRRRYEAQAERQANEMLRWRSFPILVRIGSRLLTYSVTSIAVLYMLSIVLPRQLPQVSAALTAAYSTALRAGGDPVWTWYGVLLGYSLVLLLFASLSMLFAEALWATVGWLGRTLGRLILAGVRRIITRHDRSAPSCVGSLGY